MLRPPSSTLFPYTTLFRSSTNLGPWVNRRALFSMQSVEDVFKERGLMSPQKWEMTPKGQHIELVIAEMNLFLRSEEHTSELQSRPHLVCRLLLEKKKEIQE